MWCQSQAVYVWLVFPLAVRDVSRAFVRMLHENGKFTQNKVAHCVLRSIPMQTETLGAEIAYGRYLLWR